MITAHIFGTPRTSPHSPAWESLSSLSGFCDLIVVHDYGMKKCLSEIVDEFSRIKRMVVVDTSEPVPLARMADDEWIYFGVLDEVVHEDSHHYLWDLAHHYDEFEGADVPIRMVFGACSTKDVVETRMVRRSAAEKMFFDGEVFSTSLDVSKCSPSGHLPSPVWKFTWAFPGDPSMVEYEVRAGAFTNIQGLPRCVRRLVGRYAYQPPYMK